MSNTLVDHPSDNSVNFLDIAFMIANAVGIAIYLVLASRGWRIQAENGAVPITGEPFVWVLAVPVLAGFVLANIVWGGMLLRHREPKRWLWWLITGAVWLVAIYVDFAHH
jgi:hypothetical protein